MASMTTYVADRVGKYQPFLDLDRVTLIALSERRTPIVGQNIHVVSDLADLRLLLADLNFSIDASLEAQLSIKEENIRKGGDH